MKLDNVAVINAHVGLSVSGTGNLDVTSLMVARADRAGVFIEDCDSDLFFSKVHVNNGKPNDLPDAVGLWLNRVGGAHFTDCDFIGGKLGVLLDSVGGVSRNNHWLKFTSVSADTVGQDAWHIKRGYGIQLANCWSGSFPAGNGIWIGVEVEELVITNHQWQQAGSVAIGNNCESVAVIGGLVGEKVQLFSTSKPEWPKIRNVFVRDKSNLVDEN